MNADEDATDGAGTGESEGSYEYLVFFSTLTQLAKLHDLHPVLDYGNEQLNNLFDKVRASCSCAMVISLQSVVCPADQCNCSARLQSSCQFALLASCLLLGYEKKGCNAGRMLQRPPIWCS